MVMDDIQTQDICRVCRCEGTTDRPLFHPCICTGSIKFIHQDCLVQWLRYSRKEYCELCKHRISFAPIYSPDMPKRLPIADILSGLARSMGTAIRFWLHYTLVAVAWLGIVPLSACRIYRCLFTGSVSSLFTLPLDLLSTDNLLSDIFHGCFVVTCTLSAFISLVWLREQILHGGGPDWLDQEAPNEADQGANLPVENGDAPDGVPVQEREIAVEVNQDANQERDPDPNELPANAPLIDPVLPNNNNNNVNNEDNNVDANGNGDDVNWNPIEWDRAAEELTWERLLGLDGSLLFLEHVFWVVSLNTMFILVFAFCPYHIGHFAVLEFNITSFIDATHFEGLLTSLCGYCVVGLILVVLHGFVGLIKLNRPKRILGLCYIVVKVALLSVVEIGVFPLVGGWWLDICSLSLFDATLKNREASFNVAPGTSMFIHWLVGMLYVFYFTSFIFLLREVLRPGVLWFLRNLNDPDFNPVQEMIHLPLIRHIRRFLASMWIFGSTVLLMLWLPVKIIQYVWPSFLPYGISLSSEMPVYELSFEFLFLQVILPAMLEQTHTRVWLKVVIRHWCIVVSHVLGLRSYLLGDISLNVQDGGEVIGVSEEANLPLAEANGNVGVVGDALGGEGNAPAEDDVAQGAPPGEVLGGGLGAAHQALLQRDGPTGFQPYVRPCWFGVRIFGLVIAMCVSLTLASVICLTTPIWVGRKFMTFAFGNAKVHELYSGACGLFICLLSIRSITFVASCFTLGWAQIMVKLKHWSVLIGKAVAVLLVVAGIIPLFIGTLIELVIVIPLRVPLHQTPILFFWEDWAHGVLYAKIVCAMIMMGPNWWLKSHLEQIYLRGIRNMDLNLILWRTALPVIASLGTCLTIPYVCCKSIAPLFAPQNMVLLIERRIYPALLAVYVIVCLVCMQIMQFARLYEHIKNDKYLVGKRLVNYYHSKKKKSEDTTENKALTGEVSPGLDDIPPLANEAPPEEVAQPPPLQQPEQPLLHQDRDEVVR